MATEEVLRKTLRNADGKPFQKYKGIQNTFTMNDFELTIDDVQADRTGHTLMHIRVPMKVARFPEDTYSTPSRERALRDIIARRFWESARTHARSPIPKTDGGEVYMPRPGQEILSRGSVVVTKFYVEARFTADLPSSGGKVNAEATEELIFVRLRTIMEESMYFSAYKQSKLYNHIFTNENADWIRDSLEAKGLVSFVAVGAILPRRDDDLAPMVDAVPFDCDDSLKVTMEVPNGDPIVGLGIRKGYTAVTGPTLSGRSTFADAVFAGVHNHIPGDGREYVITRSDAAFVISESGRPADAVDISMFCRDAGRLGDPQRVQGRCTSSESEFVSASEAVESGSGLLIVDEEFSNPGVIRRGFLARDTGTVTFSDIAPAMAEAGVSMLMVIGDESAVRRADSILVVDGYKVAGVEVDRIESDAVFFMPATRYPLSRNMVFEKGRKEVSVTASSIRTVEIGEYKVDVPVAALFDMAQTRMLADAVTVARDMMDGSKSLIDVCRNAVSLIEDEDEKSECGQGMHHAHVRPMDVAAVLNRHPQMLAIQKR